MLELYVEGNGNTGGRYFPHVGYFGVSPIVLSGTIRTKVPPLAQPLPVKAVYAIIRCVETKGSVERVLWDKVKAIWSSPEYTILGEWSHPFRISISPEVGKVTTSSLYLKDWRAVWKFDIAIEHEPIPYVGHRIMKSFHLDLHNHRHPSPMSFASNSVTLGNGPSATDIEVTPPCGAFGPEDTIEVAVQATPHDANAIAKKATLILERVVEYIGEERCETATVATSTADMTGQDGVFRCCLAIRLPKRTARWDVGETARTQLVSMRFQLRTKITIKAKSTRELSAAPMPVTICGTSTAQRAEANASAPVKTRKHRSSRRGLYMHEGTVEISDGILQTPSPFSPPPSDVKPILLPPDHPIQSQSIAFVFPSPPPHATYLGPLPPLSTILPETGDDSWSILRRFQQTGRRISTTASEEEAMQPSRSRQRMVELPSLDSLGLGLPTISRRPVTAPAHFSDAKDYPTPFAGDPRPQTSIGRSHPEQTLSPHTFAFTVKED